jgi:hypothetical protein
LAEAPAPGRNPGLTVLAQGSVTFDVRSADSSVCPLPGLLSGAQAFQLQPDVQVFLIQGPAIFEGPAAFLIPAQDAQAPGYSQLNSCGLPPVRNPGGGDLIVFQGGGGGAFSLKDAADIGGDLPGSVFSVNAP